MQRSVLRGALLIRGPSFAGPGSAAQRKRAAPRPGHGGC